jgi:hypothetical protein
MFVLMASSILSPLLSHCEFNPNTEKLGARFKDVIAICYTLKIALNPKFN